ncbi:MAG: class I SAM-dependent methyltransferase [Candidatus Acidiferrum sp.]
MQTGKPSRTAWAAAAHRAAHQLLEEGRIFSDPLAIRILGQDPESIARDAADNPSRLGMRLFIAARTRFAEDSLAAAVSSGVTQLVVLGAGLDTCAYRNPFPDHLRVFEVDHPATQAWKRERLAQAAIPIPSTLTFAPIDFECQTLPEGLAAAGFDPSCTANFLHLARRRPLPHRGRYMVHARIHRQPAQRRPRHLRLQRPSSHTLPRNARLPRPPRCPRRVPRRILENLF